MATRSVKLRDLRTATEASIKAVLGRKQVFRPGVLVGLWLDKSALNKLDIGPAQIAGNIAKQVTSISGIRVTPGTKLVRGGVLVGYIAPKVFR